jgi:hypothetical protein
MAKVPTEILTKRMAIDKANAQMVATVAIAAFVTIFCLVASVSVWKQDHYQSKVNSVQSKANKQLKANIDAFTSLKSSYDKFNNSQTNIIGGQSSGTVGNNNGSNSQIILDALPPNYDFPAVTSSIERLVEDQGLALSGISGTDEQLSQQSNSTSSDPAPVAMPFSFSINNMNYSAVTELTSALQNSIRPIYIDTIDLEGGSNNMTFSVTAHTYFQPGKSVNISEQIVP